MNTLSAFISSNPQAMAMVWRRELTPRQQAAREQIRRVRIGTVLAFIAPAVIPVLDAFSWTLNTFINQPLTRHNSRRNP